MLLRLGIRIVDDRLRSKPLNERNGVAVEKLRFRRNSGNLEDRKCLGKSRTSFIERPDAILFARILREGVFQQPRLLTSFETPRIDSRSEGMDNEPLSERSYETPFPAA